LESTGKGKRIEKLKKENSIHVREEWARKNSP